MAAEDQKPGTVSAAAESPVGAGAAAPGPGTPVSSGTSTLGESHTLGEQSAIQPPYPLSGAIPARPQKIYPARTAQDGHSLGEQAVYYALWSEAAPEAGSDCRVISIGYERLGALCRLHWTNVKKNLRALETKLSIETIGAENSNERIGRTYRVHSYRGILERRRNAGLLWYRKTRGVELLSSPTPSDSHTLGGSPSVGAAVSYDQAHRVGDLRTESGAHTGTVSAPPTGSLSASPTSIEKQQKGQENKTSSSVVRALGEFGIPDDHAASMLIRSCRRGAPDASEEEIVHFIRAKGELVRGSGIRNPIGFLLSAVPKCFLGEALLQHREAERRRREAEARRRAEEEADLAAWREEMARLAEDRDADPADREFARKMLDQAG